MIGSLRTTIDTTIKTTLNGVVFLYSELSYPYQHIDFMWFVRHRIESGFQKDGLDFIKNVMINDIRQKLGRDSIHRPDDLWERR